MQVFDAPEPLVSQSTRPATTIAPQALWLMNNPKVREWTTGWAHRSANNATQEPSQWVTIAYRRALQRSPSPVESKASIDFLKQQTERYRQAGSAQPELQSATDLLQTLISLNEVIYVD
jgi:hypothetical protein